MNKKSMTLNEFLGLVLALTLFFFLIIYPGSKIYASFSKQQYVNSYNKLVATIDNIASSDLTEDSTDLIMEENTAIIVFNKNLDIVKNNPADYFYKRLGGCEEGEVCICFCKKIPYVNGVRGERLCKGNCKPLDIDFINWFNPRQLGWPYIEGEENEKFKAVEGGFIYSRDWDFPKMRTIYLEKYNNLISICFNKPCINDKQRLELEK